LAGAGLVDTSDWLKSPIAMTNPLVRDPFEHPAPTGQIVLVVLPTPLAAATAAGHGTRT